jgi:hypothetical protein
MPRHFSRRLPPFYCRAWLAHAMPATPRHARRCCLYAVTLMICCHAADYAIFTTPYFAVVFFSVIIISLMPPPPLRHAATMF